MLDEDTGLFYIKGSVIGLTTFENKLLSYLIEHKNKISDYKDLLKYLYNINELNKYTRTRLITLIERLKKKIDKVVRIINIRGKGVRIEWIQKN